MTPAFRAVITGLLVLDAQFVGVWDFSPGWPQREGRFAFCIIPHPDQIRCDQIAPLLIAWPCGAPIDVVAFGWQQSASPMRPAVQLALASFSPLDLSLDGWVGREDVLLAATPALGDWNLDGAANVGDWMSYWAAWAAGGGCR